MAEAGGIRVAGPEDAGAVARLLHAFNSEYEEWSPGEETLARHGRSLIEAGEVTALLAGASPDGFSLFRHNRSIYDGRLDTYVQELYVVPERRGQGLGRALLEATMAAAREAGSTHIELNTGETDVEARSLYESAGFANREGSPDGPRMLYYERSLST
jgi:GNAT superfamily N-acetyltransferase